MAPKYEARAATLNDVCPFHIGPSAYTFDDNIPMDALP